MSKDIIEVDDYEVKDKQIVESSEDEDYQESHDNQREGKGEFSGTYKSISLNNTSLVILAMVIILLIVIFIMIFD